MADMKQYLASKYLSGAKADAILARGDGKKRKKVKRVHDDGGGAMSSGMLVQDDAMDDWGRRDDEEETAMGSSSSCANTELKIAVVESRSKAGFKPINAKTPAPDEDAPRPDEAPLVVGGDAISDEEDAAPKKFVGGLQSAAELAAENERRQRREKKLRAKAERELAEARQQAILRGEDVEDHDETVHRDESGRRIDTKALRVQQAQQRREEAEKAAEKMEWGKGIVQREDRDRRRREAEEVAAAPFARRADDARMNAEMREVERWNDPAANFLSKEHKGPRKPRYQGPPPPPNRFGILPGYRWDGVDRGNGFERKLMQAENERKMNRVAAYAYSTDDM